MTSTRPDRADAVALLLAAAALYLAGYATALSVGKASLPRPSMPDAIPETPFQNPLGCDATMVVSVGGIITQRPGCYVRKEPQVWL